MDTGREVSANIEIPAGATIKIVPSRPANIDYITLGSRAADSELIEAETGYMVDRNGNQIDQAPATDDQYASGGAASSDRAGSKAPGSSRSHPAHSELRREYHVPRCV